MYSLLILLNDLPSLAVVSPRIDDVTLTFKKEVLSSRPDLSVKWLGLKWDLLTE